MEQAQSVTPQAAPAEQAPVADHFGGTGPNEFEQQWSAMSAAMQQAAASPEESGPAPSTPGAPSGSPGDGATNANGLSAEESFLSPDEQSQFDTNSPEYRAMQASFTKRMQALAEKERQLEARAKPELSETPVPQSAPQEIDYSKFKVSVPLPDELEPYREPISQIAIEVAKQTVSQLQAQAMAVEQSQQQAQLQTRLRQELTNLQNGPRAAEFAKHYNTIAAIATESPTMLKAMGLEGILNFVSGSGPRSAPVENGQNGYAQGVQDTLGRMASRKQAATYEPAQSPQGATTSAAFQIKPGTSMSDAVAQAFQAAKARHVR